MASIYVLCGATIGLCLCGIVITISLVDNITPVEHSVTTKNNNTTTTKSKSRMWVWVWLIFSFYLSFINSVPVNKAESAIKSELGNLCKLFGSIDIYLLLPLTVYTSFDLSFRWTEFNRVKRQESPCFELAWIYNFLTILPGVYNMFDKCELCWMDVHGLWAHGLGFLNSLWIFNQIYWTIIDNISVIVFDSVCWHFSVVVDTHCK